MANHHSAPDGIADDFFEQIFSYGGEGPPAASPAGGEDGNFAGMALQLSSGQGQGGPCPGDHMVGGGGGFLSGGCPFPLGLSLEQGGGGYGKAGDGSSSGGKRFRDELAVDSGKNPSVAKSEATSLFPAFGHVQAHQIRSNSTPHVNTYHAQATQQPPAPRPRVRARRGQATDPHSIAERLRRERIAERIRALQDLVPNTNKADRAAILDEIVDYVKFLRLQVKADRAAILDEIVDYVKFLRLQVKVLSMSRLGGAGAVAQLVADVPLSSVEGGNNQQVWEKWSTDGTEQQVAKLMEEDVGSAMQFLQSKALCIMPISLAAAIYNTPHQMEAPAFVNPESNAPS